MSGTTAAIRVRTKGRQGLDEFGSRPSVYRIGAALDQNDPFARLQARETPGIGKAKSVSSTVVRSRKRHLENVGLRAQVLVDEETYK